MEEGISFLKEVNGLELKNGLYASAVVKVKDQNLRIGVANFPFKKQTQGFVVLKKETPLSLIKKKALELSIPLSSLKILKSRHAVEEGKKEEFITIIGEEEGIKFNSSLFEKLALFKREVKELTYQVKTNFSFPKERMELLSQKTTPFWLKKLAQAVEKVNGRVVIPSQEGYKVSLIIEPEAIYVRGKVASNYVSRDSLEISVPSDAIVFENSENLYAVIPLSSWEEVNQIKKELLLSYALKRQSPEKELEPEF